VSSLEFEAAHLHSAADAQTQRVSALSKESAAKTALADALQVTLYIAGMAIARWRQKTVAGARAGVDRDHGQR